MPSNEPIAIVGLGCRFPGGVSDPETFWELLRNGVDAISEVPESRWNADRYYHRDPSAPGKMVSRWGGFIENPGGFDAAFFGIAPREASRVDPQHRWLMETTWEAIEDAGLSPEQLAGSRTAVVIGVSHADYPRLHQASDLVDGYMIIGSALSIAANRLSYLLNLKGPSMAIDTACSSSLSALHLAVQSILTGESDYAIVGGCNAVLTPAATIGFSQAHMLSPRGRCRAFDATADGYVRAEGAASALIMPWRTAQSLGLQPRALLLATAVNQDGHSAGLTVPSQQAQEDMVREALYRAGAEARDVVYVEAHGTGTPVGDPIEARALAGALGDGRAPGKRLLIGSVKTNIGHLESAAGMAGLIKAILVLEHRTIPASLHLETPNPLLPTDRIEIATTLRPLPNGSDRAPLVGVNSFGFGGTNAHALLAASPAVPILPAPSTVQPAADEVALFPLSARSPAALRAYATAYADRIAARSPENFTLPEFCAAAALGKAHLSLRAAVAADSLPHLESRLRSFAESTDERSAVTTPPRVAFVFSGQGPQWWAMGRQLYRREPVVRAMWEECDEMCRRLGGFRLLETLLAEEKDSRLDRTDFAQPALFALQAGLVQLWRSWGIQPAGVIGHSVGEAAAAWAAGLLDLEPALRVVLARGRWQAKTHGSGRMLAANLAAQEAKSFVDMAEGHVTIAAFNAPRQVTFSGDAAALGKIADELQQREIFCRFLSSEYAFHSAHMDAIEAGLRHELAGIAGNIPTLPMISTVTGTVMKAEDMNAAYWWRNVREPVRFAAGIERLLGDGCSVFLEIAPHPVLGAALAETGLAHPPAPLSLASLRRGEDERNTMLQALGSLYRAGAPVNWEALYSRPARRVRLPAYPWQRQSLWHESAAVTRDIRRPPSHPLLGDRQPSPQPTWISRFDIRTTPWLADHRISDSAVVPAAAYIEMAAAAVREYLGEPPLCLEGIKFHHLLFLPSEHSVDVCLRLDPASSSFKILTARSETPSEWELQAEGFYRAGRMHVPPPVDLDELRARHPTERDPHELYQELKAIGQVYGPSFQGLASLRLERDQALFCEIRRPVQPESSQYLLFPPVLDSCFHSSFALRRSQDARAAVIISLRRLQLFQALPENFWVAIRLGDRLESSYYGDLALYSTSGAVIARLDRLDLRSIDSESRQAPKERRFYGFAWEAQPPPAPVVVPTPARASVLLFSDDTEFGREVTEQLHARRVATTVVVASTRAAQSNGATMQVDPQEPDWAGRLWSSLAARAKLPTHVLFLCGRDGARHCTELLSLAKGRLALVGDHEPARWLVATRGAQAISDEEDLDPAPAAPWGFVRTLQTEHPDWRPSLVDVASAVPAAALIDELFAHEVEPEVALRKEMRWARRLRHLELPSPPQANPPPACVLSIGQPGRIDSLQFRGAARPTPGPGEVEVKVHAAGLNFRDVMKALGIYPLRDGESPQFGDELAGEILRVGRGVTRFRAGDRVMGVVPGGGAFGSHVCAHGSAIWKIPGTLSFAEAASVPIVFGTAYHALHNLARLRRGETILVHAATGGVGLAAVQLAQKSGAIVLGTAGSEEKRAYLRGLGLALVMDSRTLDFADESLRFTGGRGVDVVLNSLAGSFQLKSLEACAAHGRFVEIGKRDLFEGTALPLSVFQKSLSFFAFDLTSVLAANGSESRRLRRFLASGDWKPIPLEGISVDSITSAFRKMQTAKHLGKIVIEHQPGQLPEVPAEFWPSPDGTYLITGGLSGFGLATAAWLVARGARHLALMSRRGKPSAADAPRVDALRKQGATVQLFATDVSDSDALGRALQRLAHSGPALRGVFHAAMVLRDGPIFSMTREDLEAVFAPKMTGAWNLHQQTRELSLDAFVLYSSISSVVGALGHGNYAAANAFMDALARHRRRHGLPGLSVNWGQIADVGVAAENPEVSRYLEGIGIRAVPSRDALAALARLIPNSEPQVGVMDVDWDKLSRASSKFGDSPVFRELVEAGRSVSMEGHNPAQWRDAVLRLPAAGQLDAVAELVVGQLSATLGTAPAAVDRHAPLTSMDSLMAVELKVRIETHTGCQLPIDLFNADLTPARLAERVLKQLAISAPDPATSSPGVVHSLPETPGIIEAPLLRTTPIPLGSLIREGKAGPLLAAAVMSWPDALFARTPVSTAEFFQRIGKGKTTFDLILETTLGSIGIFMLPLTTSQVTPGSSDLAGHVLEGMSQAASVGARCLALTGLIAPATNYGTNITSMARGDASDVMVTTGHGTTVAAVILNLQALLREADRCMEEETVLCFGIGSIGLGAVRLMLDVLPHPAELWLCDPYRSEAFFEELIGTLRGGHEFRGPIRIVSGSDLPGATVILGATNAENVIDVAVLAPGTLVVDDSAPHCMSGAAALARFTAQGDILCTEGGFVHSPIPMPRLLRVPESVAPDFPTELPELLLSFLTPHDITACILSALLSVLHPELEPTTGLVSLKAARLHWQTLGELGFTASPLGYEGVTLPAEGVAAFGMRFGRHRRPVSSLVTQ